MSSQDVGASESERSLFEKAKEYIDTGWVFRKATYMYAERKSLMCLFVHTVATVVIFAHFFIVKYMARGEELEKGENRYWLKRVAQSIAFSLKHTALFHMALIPLTMSHRSIITASENHFISQFIPFNRMVRFHIYLGYNAIITICVAAICLTYVVLVCAEGEGDYCSKLYSEIMITGYLLLALPVIVMVTSYLRHVIPYRTFYILHHLVFVIYVLTCIHTYDNVQRRHERDRSQTFKWVTGTLMYYICDRLAIAMNHSYKTPLVFSAVATSTQQGEAAGSKMVVIRMSRPPLFHFQPGQYAKLRIRDIDNEYHAFSIASSPNSDEIEFYIEVFAEGSWTHNLYDLLETADENDGEGQGPKIIVDLMGPYGTSLGNTREYSHAIGIGSGTGIVPMMSLLRQHVEQLLLLDPAQHAMVQERHQRKIYQMSQAATKKKGSVVDKLVEMICCLERKGYERTTGGNRLSARLRDITDEDGFRAKSELKWEARRATLPMYGTVSLLFLPSLGIVCLGCTLSFHALNETYHWMDELLAITSVTFHGLFAVVALAVEDVSDFKTFVDIAFLIIAMGADLYFFQHQIWSTFKTKFLMCYAVVNLYIVLSLWYNATKSRRQESWRRIVVSDGLQTMDKVRLIWVTRSAALVSKLYPDIDGLWTSLCDAWGVEAANKVCEISIYVTDRDKEACAILREELQTSELYQAGAVKFARPDFPKIIENHTLDLISEDSNTVTSHTLLTFCGNPNLSVMVHQAKISSDISIYLTNNTYHTMEFVSESYGGANKKGQTKKKKKSPPPSQVVPAVVPVPDTTNLAPKQSFRRALSRRSVLHIVKSEEVDAAA